MSIVSHCSPVQSQTTNGDPPVLMGLPLYTTLEIGPGYQRHTQKKPQSTFVADRREEK